MERNDRRDRAGGLRALCCGLLAAILTGCQTAPPATAPAQRVEALRALGFVENEEGWMLDLSTPILFDIDRDELRPETRKAVGNLADSLVRIGIRRVRVEGHTDSHGTHAHNLGLSRRRAEAVARELTAHGFSDAAIARQAWGSEYPAAPNDNADGRALNRRVTIVVVPAEIAAE